MKLKILSALLAATLLSVLSISTASSQSSQEPIVIKIVAKKFEFKPAEITVKKGVPVVLEFTSEDRVHGFNMPDFNIRTDIKPGAAQTIRFTPDKTGRFPFHCDVFCGAGHDNMKGVLVVTD